MQNYASLAKNVDRPTRTAIFQSRCDQTRRRLSGDEDPDQRLWLSTAAMWNAFKRGLTLATDRIYSLPVLVLMPHSRCNCRCVMCDIWKANQEKKEISAAELEKHLADFKALNVRQVLLSGGEALMHENLWQLCRLLKDLRVRITLLSTGLLLKKWAAEVIQHCDEVIVSLDGSRDIHNKIRNIPLAFERLVEGAAELKRQQADFRVCARSVIQRANYFDFVPTVETAKGIGLDQISFLGADLSTAAFNRPVPWNPARASEVALNHEEAENFAEILAASFATLKPLYDSRFIAESPEKIMRIAQYYRAINGQGQYPVPACNAPWVSAVMEADGSVRPCFFHQAYGNIHQQRFGEIINSPDAIEFRQQLQVKENPICRKCVCSLNLSLRRLL